MPHPRSNSFANLLPVLAGVLLLSAKFVVAQAPSELPSAPEPQPSSSLLASYLMDFGFTPSGVDSDAQGGSGDAAPAETETLTMFPHSDSAPYLVSGQANSIFQMHGHFRSPYEGPNSLIDDFETKASEVATLYLGYEWHANSRNSTDFIVNFENAGGRGISQALGLAGETNVDVVRDPTLGIGPYLARGEIHQIVA
jgi:high affinity Mn2+ porin